MARQVSWTRDWTHQNYTGLTKSQIAAKKAQYLAKALVKIKNKIKALQKIRALPIRTTFTVKWTKERSGPFYYLLTYLKPPAKLVPRSGKDLGKGGSQVSPTPPTGP